MESVTQQSVCSVAVVSMTLNSPGVASTRQHLQTEKNSGEIDIPGDKTVYKIDKPSLDNGAFSVE